MLTVSVAELPGPIGFGSTEQRGLSAGDGSTEQVKDTELLNPCTPATLNVDPADCPAVTEAGVNGVADTEKSAGNKELNVAVMV